MSTSYIFSLALATRDSVFVRLCHKLDIPVENEDWNGDAEEVTILVLFQTYDIELDDVSTNKNCMNSIFSLFLFVIFILFYLL